ncbi:hypothetical protein [Leeuwenhoekiella sp. LLG6367-2.1]|uniref:hypothetical protein n=1 Tax=Leeuwenhoekiella sp. LLG6367-2.1 TaxID=3160833 RepID=UPI003867853E
MSSTAQILDAFFDRLKAENMVIVHRDLVTGSHKQEVRLKQKRYLKNASLTCKQIAEAELWGDIGEHRVRNLIKQHCKAGEILEVERGKTKITKVIRAGVERVARIRSVVWQD